MTRWVGLGVVSYSLEASSNLNLMKDRENMVYMLIKRVPPGQLAQDQEGK
jgi:hypothetical protein